MVLSRVVRGALAGLVATAAMSVVMVASERAGVMLGQPPRKIVDRLIPSLGHDGTDVVALVSHGVYGAAAGSVLAPLIGRTRAAPLLGAVSGLALWALGYEGWVPAMRVLPPAHRDQPGRVATMIAAHLVYGAVLGRLLHRG